MSNEITIRVTSEIQLETLTSTYDERIQNLESMNMRVNDDTSMREVEFRVSQLKAGELELKQLKQSLLNGDIEKLHIMLDELYKSARTRRLEGEKAVKGWKEGMRHRLIQGALPDISQALLEVSDVIPSLKPIYDRIFSQRIVEGRISDALKGKRTEDAMAGAIMKEARAIQADAETIAEAYNRLMKQLKDKGLSAYERLAIDNLGSVLEENPGILPTNAVMLVVSPLAEAAQAAKEAEEKATAEAAKAETAIPVSPEKLEMIVHNDEAVQGERVPSEGINRTAGADLSTSYEKDQLKRLNYSATEAMKEAGRNKSSWNYQSSASITFARLSKVYFDLAVKLSKGTDQEAILDALIQASAAASMTQVYAAKAADALSNQMTEGNDNG